MTTTDEASRRRAAISQLERASNVIVRWPGWTLAIMVGVLIVMVLRKL